MNELDKVQPFVPDVTLSYIAAMMDANQSTWKTYFQYTLRQPAETRSSICNIPVAERYS